MAPPTVQSLPAGNPRNAAIAMQNANNQQQLRANTLAGGKKNKYKRGGAGQVVPQVNTTYTPTGGPGQTPNDIISKTAGHSSQASTNATYDNYSTVNGGRRKKRKTINKKSKKRKTTNKKSKKRKTKI
jgi:hypothetical protein